MGRTRRRRQRLPRARPVRWCAAAVLTAAAFVWAAPAAAQGGDPNPGALTLTGGVDFLNAYHFRGLPQDEGGFGSIIWPYADLGIALRESDGVVKTIAVSMGTWNSLHTGGATLGSDGPFRKLWYESDFYLTLGLGFGRGTSLGITYTAYTSPNGSFSTVKEFAFKLAVDDSAYFGDAAVRPYVLIAREFGLSEERVVTGAGQADGGTAFGTYMEIGAAPGLTMSRLSVAVPLKIGLSPDNYYEGFTGDERFGFFSLAGIATLPFTSRTSRFGTWNVHGGVEYLRLGDRNQGFGANQVVGSIGVGFNY
jgi:hypothetical protein